MATTNDKPKSKARVIIVGAGPVGMLVTLRLGQAGIDTLLIEGHESLLHTTRAVAYMPVVLPALHELGILDKVKSEAYLNTVGVGWRDISDKPLGQVPFSSTNSDKFEGVLLMGQDRLSMLLMDEFNKYPSITVRFGLKLKSIIDDPSSPTVNLTAHNPKRPEHPETHLSADYVIGTDGANSKTRDLLDLTFDGFTYTDFTMIGTDVIYDFFTHEAMTPLTFIVDPTEWAIIVYTAQDENGIPHGAGITGKPQWRVTYVEDPNLPSDPDAIWKRAEKQLPKYVKPGVPWKIVRAEPYVVSQRVASQAIKGRVALAGDALHSNNPTGGLGLTGGILDAFCYGNALVRVLVGGESPDLLIQCAESRRDVWINVTNKLSQENVARLRDMDQGAVKARDAMFRTLNGEGQAEVGRKIRQGWDRMLTDDFSHGVKELIARAGQVNSS